MSIKQTAWVSAALFGLVGCLSAPPPPEDWAAQVSNSSCWGLDGVYANSGESAQGAQIDLTSLLARPRGGEIEADSVVLTASDTSIAVVAYSGADRVAAWQAPTDLRVELSCKDGWTVFARYRADHTPGQSSPLVGQWQTLRMARAKDGTLLLESHKAAIGTMFRVVPAASEERRRYRFKPARTAIES